MNYLDSLWQPRKTSGRNWLILLLITSVLFIAPILFSSASFGLDANDHRGLFYPWWSIAQDTIQSGRFPLWDTSTFSGYPYINNPQTALFYPFTWLGILLPTNTGVALYLLLHIWLAGAGMFLFTRSLGSHPLGSGLSALVFSLSGFMAVRIYAGHIGFIAVHTWIPWILLATAWSIQKRTVARSIIASLPFGLAILAGHITSLIYVGIIWGIFVLYLLFAEEEKWNVFRSILIAGCVGMCLSAVQLLLLIDLVPFTSRASLPLDEAFRFSLPPAHLLTFLVPIYFGEPTRIGYWSIDGFEEFIYYAGVLPIIILPLTLRKYSRLILWFIGIGLLGLLLALGNYGFLYEWVYAIFPPFRLGRAPARAAFMALFALSVLLALGITRWEDQDENNESNLIRWIIGIGGIAGLSALSAILAVFVLNHPSDLGGRLWHQASGWMLFLLFFVGSGGLLWGYINTQGNQRRLYGTLLILLTLIDLFTWSNRFIRVASTGEGQFWSDAGATIGDETGRVIPWGLGIFEQNRGYDVGLESVFGYNTLEFKPYIDLLSSVPDPRSRAYDVIGARYILTGDPHDHFLEDEEIVRLIGQTDSVWVYEKNTALPIVRMVHNFEVIQHQSEAIARVHAPDFDVATTVTLSETPDCSVSSPVDASQIIVIGQYPGYWRIQTQSDTSGIVVIAETNFPGWEAVLDEQTSLEVITAYTALKAVCVPAGEHIVELSYRPRRLMVGAFISLIALFSIVGAGVYLRRQVDD